MFAFDNTVNLGQLVTFIGFIVGGVAFAQSLRSRLSAVEIEVKKMSGVLVAIGRQDERLVAMDRRIDDLQHGRGFVLEGMGELRSLRAKSAD